MEVVKLNLNEWKIVKEKYINENVIYIAEIIYKLTEDWCIGKI